jgi:hypothetical protein
LQVWALRKAAIRLSDTPTQFWQDEQE